MTTSPVGTKHNSSTTSLFGRMSARSSFISKKDIKVSVQLLHDSETVVNEFKRSATGKDVLDYVCECMNVQEKDYFGLRYQDSHKYRYWVDLTQSIGSLCKQFKSDNLALRLRFRYYPSNVSQLREELTRYQLNVQLQRDLLHGRLYCPQPVAAQLAAYILQSQVGDYDEETAEGAKYVSEYKLLLKQTPKMEEKIAEIHKGIRGMSAAEAEKKMVELASTVETYGFDPYTVKDAKNPSSGNVYIGATHRGILIFHGNQKAHHMEWSEVTRIDYTGQELRIYPKEGYEPVTDIENTMNNNNETTSIKGSNGNTTSSPTGDKSIVGKSPSIRVLRYQCPSRTFAKHLWVHLLSQKAFFNESTADNIKPLFSKPRIPLITRGSTFRFPSQRVLREIETSPVEERRVDFSRYELPKQPPRVEPPTMTKYQTLSNIKLNGNGHVANGVGLANGKKTDAAREFDLDLNDNSTDEPVKELHYSPLSSTPSTSSAAQNISVVSVHLTKVETRKEQGDEKKKITVERDTVVEGREEEKAQFILVDWKLPSPSNLAVGAPLATSTPKANGISVERKERGGEWKGDAVGISPIVPPTLKQEESLIVKESRGATVINILFLVALLLFIFVALCIVIFEREEELSYVESTPWLYSLHHEYYEPAKRALLSRYAQLVKRH